MRKAFGVLLMVFVLFSGFAQQLEVKFATGEWAPFTSEKLPEYGAFTELVSAICKAGGIKPVYEFYPWPRAEKTVQDGQAFAAFPYAMSDERKAKYDFSEVLTYGQNVMLYYTRNAKTARELDYRKIDDLKSFRIGCQSGTFFIADLEKAGVPVTKVETLDQSIVQLRLGRVDYVIDNQVVLFDTIKRLYPEEIGNFKVLPKVFGEKTPNVLIISRSYPDSGEILKKFHAGLAAIKKSGEYAKILEKYRM